MKVTNKKGVPRRSISPAPVSLPFIDEYQRLMSLEPLKSMHLNYLKANSAGLNFTQPALTAKRLVVTQTLVKRKRGKTIMVGTTRDAATGEPIPAPARKFLPVQVTRIRTL